ncbi:MAG: MerR family transcriptional regulator [Planctomycetota bacterium]
MQHYTIGEFSKMTGLPVKTLRFYQEQDLLLPSSVDPANGYRYYGADRIDRARVIQSLRSLEFSVREVRELLAGADDDADILGALEAKNRQLVNETRRLTAIQRALAGILKHESEARELMSGVDYEIEEKTIAALKIAGLRMKGAYRDCGPSFSKLGRRYGRHLAGKPMMLIYDESYRESDADFEVCMPVKRGDSRDDMVVREIPGGTCLSLLHKGPYDELPRSYGRLFEYAKERGLEFALPSREVYRKGPGMIFKGNPKRYLTEIQMFLKDSEKK